MSDQPQSQAPGVEEPPWALMAPGDQAVYMPCSDGGCPQQKPGVVHQHLDHVVHQEPTYTPEPIDTSGI